MSFCKLFIKELFKIKRSNEMLVFFLNKILELNSMISFDLIYKNSTMFNNDFFIRALERISASIPACDLDSLDSLLSNIYFCSGKYGGRDYEILLFLPPDIKTFMDYVNDNKCNKTRLARPELCDFSYKYITSNKSSYIGVVEDFLDSYDKNRFVLAIGYDDFFILGNDSDEDLFVVRTYDLDELVYLKHLLKFNFSATNAVITDEGDEKIYLSNIKCLDESRVDSIVLLFSSIDFLRKKNFINLYNWVLSLDQNYEVIGVDIDYFSSKYCGKVLCNGNCSINTVKDLPILLFEYLTNNNGNYSVDLSDKDSLPSRLALLETTTKGYLSTDCSDFKRPLNVYNNLLFADGNLSKVRAINKFLNAVESLELCLNDFYIKVKEK